MWQCHGWVSICLIGVAPVSRGVCESTGWADRLPRLPVRLPSLVTARRRNCSWRSGLSLYGWVAGMLRARRDSRDCATLTARLEFQLGERSHNRQDRPPRRSCCVEPFS